ncbi:E3 ubiquitin-protein ligase UBR3 [Pelomyxa schiedti]|nr:E3 ubiquitin-protein ligase UBR3 [Pelomyxa schiedti]
MSDEMARQLTGKVECLINEILGCVGGGGETTSDPNAVENGNNKNKPKSEREKADAARKWRPLVDVIDLSFCCGRAHDEFFRECSELLAGTVCVELWGDGSYFYRCRDCGISPTRYIEQRQVAVVIVEILTRGDLLVIWRGFCPKHGNVFEGDPLSLLRPPHNSSVPVAISVALNLLSKSIAAISLHNRQEEHYTALGISLLQWLRKLSQVELFLKIVRIHCIKILPAETITALALFSSSSPVVAPESLLGLWTKVMLKLGPDFLDVVFTVLSTSTTLNFLTVSKFHNDAVNSKEPPEKVCAVIFKLSPQLLNVPNVVSTMHDSGFLLNLSRNLVTLFKTALTTSADNKTYANLNNTSELTNALLSDFYSALQHEDIARDVCTNRPDILQNWVEQLSLLQGVDGQVREPAAHDFTESRQWVEIQQFELVSVEAFPVMAKAISKSSNPQQLGNILKLISTAMEQRAMHLPSPLSSVDIQPISMFIPLHQIEIVFQQPLNLQACKNHKFKTLTTFQGKWVYNGYEMVDKASYYALDNCNIKSLDVHLIQVACCIFGPEAFLHRLVVSFGLQRYFGALCTQQPQPEDSNTTEPQWDKAAASNIEGVISLLIVIIQSRTHTAPHNSLEQEMRKKLIQLLAQQPTTHSKIWKSLGGDIIPVGEDLTEKILSHVSTFSKPTHKPGQYHLKESCWTEFDAWTALLARERQQAIEMLMEFRKKKSSASANATPLLPLWSGTQLPPLNRQYQPLLSLLHSLELQQLLKTCLTAFSKSPNIFSDFLVHSCVRLMWLMISNPIPNPHPEQWFNCNSEVGLLLLDLATKEEIVLHQELKNSMIKLICELYGHNAVLKSSLQRLHPEFVHKHIILAGSSEISPSSVSSLQSDRKREAQRRQAALLEKMRNQQEQFLKTISETEKSAAAPPSTVNPTATETHHTDDENQQQQLCLLCKQPSTEAAPLSQLVLIHKSNLLALARRKAIDPSKWGSVDPDGTWNLPSPQSSNSEPTTNEQRNSTARMTSSNPYFTNQEFNSSLALNGCRHLIHWTCYKTYLHKSHEVNNVFGEIMCPICRRLSNSALPILPGAAGCLGQMVSSPTVCPSPQLIVAQLASTFSQLFSHPPLRSQQNSVGVKQVQEFVRHLNIIFTQSRTFSVDDTTVTLCNFLTSSIMNTELCFRDPKTGIDHWRNQIALLSSLSDAATALASKSLSGKFPTMRHLLTWLGISIPIPEDSSHNAEDSTMKLPSPAEEAAANIKPSEPAVHQPEENEEDLAMVTRMMEGEGIIAEDGDFLEFEDDWEEVSDVDDREEEDEDEDEEIGSAEGNANEPGQQQVQEREEPEISEEQGLPPFPLISPASDLFCVLVKLAVHLPAQQFSNLTCMVLLAHIAQLIVHLMDQCETCALNTTGFESWFQIIPPSLGTHCARHFSVSMAPAIRKMLADGVPVFDIVKVLAVPFLRRTYILQKAMGLVSDIEPHEMSCDSLSNALKIPQSVWLCTEESLKPLVSQWCSQLTFDVMKTSPYKPLPFAPALPFSLIPLPPRFQDVLIRLQSAVCNVCRQHPESVSLCLLCGAIVCPGSKCCGPEGYEHAQVCSGGEGVCLMLKYSVCFVVSRYWTGTTNTLFLDQYGEPDPELRRGRDLFLDISNYTRLLMDVTSHGLELDSQLITRRTDYLAEEW